MPRLALSPVAALVAVVALLALPSSASAEPDPMAGAPAVGDCFDVTYKQGMRLSLREEPVACRRQHTLDTFVVGELPASVDWDSPADRIHRAVRDACVPARDQVLGPNPATQFLSLYDYLWFQPTPAQIESGARWFSCHFVLVGDHRLFPLRKEPSRLDRSRMPDSIARCATRVSTYTACSAPHTARAVHAVVVTKKATTRNVEAAAARVCPRHVPKGYSGYANRPLGPRSFVLACFARTRR